TEKIFILLVLKPIVSIESDLWRKLVNQPEADFSGVNKVFRDTALFSTFHCGKRKTGSGAGLPSQISFPGGSILVFFAVVIKIPVFVTKFDGADGLASGRPG